MSQSGNSHRLNSYLTTGQERFHLWWPGFAVSAIVAVCAQFISEHYGAPAMLMALLLGMALNFLGEENTRQVAGINMTARTVLRLGVALLGARISVELLTDLGPGLVSLVVLAVIATIGFGLFVARFFKQDWRFGLLTGGSVAICGASAAMAVSAILPKSETHDRDLLFTVLAVTVLSTVAMVIYPIMSGLFGFDARIGGVFIGGTIHDVAQVVGAGFSISTEAGETATLVKLIRVAMLAPVILTISLVLRARGLNLDENGKRPPLLPSFVVGFLVLATLNSLGIIPPFVAEIASAVSKWALLTAIAAVGLKTSIAKIMAVGGPAITLVVGETLFIGLFVLIGLQFLG